MSGPDVPCRIAAARAPRRRARRRPDDRGHRRLEAHVLLALDLGIPARAFGRIHHAPTALLSDLLDGMRTRGLSADETTFTPAGRKTKDRVEALTDELAAVAYQVLDAAELDELMTALEPRAQQLVAAQDWD